MQIKGNVPGTHQVHKAEEQESRKRKCKRIVNSLPSRPQGAKSGSESRSCLAVTLVHRSSLFCAQPNNGPAGILLEPNEIGNDFPRNFHANACLGELHVSAERQLEDGHLVLISPLSVRQ
jgi:hypothetical protein